MKKLKNGTNLKNTNGRISVSLMLTAIMAFSCTSLLTGCGTSNVQTSVPSAVTATVNETTTADITTQADITFDISVTDVQTTITGTENHDIQNETTAGYAAGQNETGNKTDNTTDKPQHGIDETTAINNVKELIGSDAQIISCTKGKSKEGFDCWVVVASAAAEGSANVTFYSGYQFCYPADEISAAAADSSQNPMMNFIGSYSNGRATMAVSCLGKDRATIRISWGNSAFETVYWNMSGNLETTDDGITVTYDNCIKQTFKYSESSELISNFIDYEDGKGTVEFNYSDNKCYWHDAQEDAGANSTFSYSSYNN